MSLAEDGLVANDDAEDERMPRVSDDWAQTKSDQAEQELLEEADHILPSVESDDDGDENNSLLDPVSPIQGERLDRVLRTPSPIPSPAETESIPDDTPSLNGSLASLPLAATPSPRGSISRTPSGAIRPFERRFQSRFSVSPSPSRTGSPAFLNTHSRQSSLASQIFRTNGEQSEPEQTPWEVVRWTRLRKISTQCFSETGKRQLGTPTCLAVSASIVVGTSKGLILVFDYHQNLKSIIGQGTKAAEAGSITSLAISADYTTVAGGHSTGAIFTWEISHPARPFLAIPSLSPKDRASSSDGHIEDRSILHLGFLGTRHTALVSADDGGMAFSHLATRGLGAMGRSVKTTRLLGRYPSMNPADDVNRKPSSVLAFAPLPLGNAEQATDTMGLTALLTPYLLVVVSTTPIAQTQHKASRPKEITPHGAMSGCLAWFPPVRLKVPSESQEVSNTKLVYCWSDLLNVLDIEIGAIDPDDKDKQPALSFNQKSRWKCEESIVAVQWLSRSVIAVLTISQRLVILEDVGQLHVMESVDLIQRHIYHKDFFSTRLRLVVEQDEQDADIHGVIADAFYMSFRAYKGRMFLLGFSDISVGTLSNWADRLTALVEHGDDIAAIRLGLVYYQHGAGKVSVGLPEDAQSRHDTVRSKVLALLNASLRYRLSETSAEDDRLNELSTECFDACLVMDEKEFLLDDAYDLYKDADETGIFIDHLESHIVDGDITSLPPILVKDVITHYTAANRETRLEELLCRLEAHTFDLDQITRLCKEHLLYDALIYVWNRALMDWISPFLDLISLIRSKELANGSAGYDQQDREDAAQKVFPYLAFSLTGRRYPNGELMEDDAADNVRQDLYKTLFSPHGTLAGQSGDVTDIAYPYLTTLLHFDIQNFMSMMNEAFEDAYLNTNEDADNDTIYSSTYAPQSNMTRQQIVSILLQVMSNDNFTPAETIFLDMFIARSLPKYPQFLILSGTALHSILQRLCSFTDLDLAEECQLSVEYLLSVYHPTITAELAEQLREAEFFRVLKTIFRSESRWLDLINLSFEDTADRQTLFRDVSDAVANNKDTSTGLVVEDLICTNATTLAFENLAAAVRLVLLHLRHKIDDFLAALAPSDLQYAFLQEMLEPDQKGQLRSDTGLDDQQLTRLTDRYVQLMCIHDPTHVSDVVLKLDSADLHLNQILPEIEKQGIVDAAVQLLARGELAREAIDRLTKHLHSLGNALGSLLESAIEGPGLDEMEATAKDLVREFDKYFKLGIWLCQGQTEAAKTTKSARLRRGPVSSEDDLTTSEHLWLTLIDHTVQISQSIHLACEDLPSSTYSPSQPLRSLIQQIFTALLTSTTATPTTRPSTTKTQTQPTLRSSSFIPIFTLFLHRASQSSTTSGSLTDLRAVLEDIFAAYAYEADVLQLAAKLLDRDAFAEISAIHTRRVGGWRPRTQVCEKCKMRVSGQGTGEEIWDAWAGKEGEKIRASAAKPAARGLAAEAGKGKGQALEEEAAQDAAGVDAERFALVVFACRHVFHRKCLDETRGVDEGDARYVCPVCRERTVAAGASA